MTVAAIVILILFLLLILIVPVSIFIKEEKEREENVRVRLQLSIQDLLEENRKMREEEMFYLRLARAKQQTTIDVEKANEKELTKPEVIFYLERCKDWFPPYTPEVEKWNEAIDKAIEALKQRKESEE